MRLRRYSVFFALLFSPIALAYNSQDVVNVTVSGNIIQPLCTVNVPSQVDLGRYARQDLSAAGANSANVPFTIALTECSRGMTHAVVTFTGTPYDDGIWGTAIYANQLEAGATGVGLQLYNNDGNALVNLANGVNYTFPVDVQSAGGKLDVIARMYTPEGKTTAGNFKTALTLTFTYN